MTESMKRMKFKHARRRFGKEQELLRLDLEADISGFRVRIASESQMGFCFVSGMGGDFEII